jgi:hypothetical protein
MTDNLAALIEIEQGKAQAAEARARNLEARRDENGRFTRAVIRPAKHLGLIEALHPRIVPTDQQTT